MNMPNMNNRDYEWNTQIESLTKPKSRLPHLPLGFFIDWEIIIFVQCG